MWRDSLAQFFSTKSLFFSFFCYSFSRSCTIISGSDFDFERILKLQQLLYFTLEPRHLLLQEDALSPKVLYSFAIILVFFSNAKDYNAFQLPNDLEMIQKYTH